MDFNKNGWWESEEKVFSELWMEKGKVHSFSVFVPKEAGPICYTRLRCSSTKNLLPTGGANDGEVEDYMLTVKPSAVTLSNIQADYTDFAILCVQLISLGILIALIVATIKQWKR
jgi:hypothetical protein